MIYVVRRLVLLLCLSVSAASQASIGTDWLAAQENIDGSYGQAADISTTFQSTTEALRILISANAAPVSGVSGSLAFVDGEWSADAEYLSRKIIVKAKARKMSPRWLMN